MSNQLEEIKKQFLRQLSATKRTGSRHQKPRVDKAELGDWIFARIRRDITSHLPPDGQPQTIIIEKLLDDPQAGDLLLEALYNTTADLNLHTYMTNAAEDSSGESLVPQPAIFDLRFLRRALPRNSKEAKDFEQRVTTIAQVVREAYEAKKNVILLVKRSYFVPRQFKMPQTQHVSLIPLTCAELAEACRTLFEDLTVPIALDEERDRLWVQRLVPSDFLENSKSTDNALINDLKATVTRRVAALGGSQPLVQLDRIIGREQVKQWPMLVKEALRINNEKAWLLAGRGAILKAGKEHFAEMLAKSVADYLELAFISVTADDYLDQPLMWLDRADDLAPAMLYIGHGNWQNLSGQIRSAKEAGPEAHGKAKLLEMRRSLMQENMARFNLDAQVLLATAVPQFEDIDETFIHPSIFSRQIDAGYITAMEAGLTVLSRIGQEYCSSPLMKKRNVEKIGKLFPDIEISPIEILHLQRRRVMNNRLLRFSDLVDMKLRGAVDANQDVSTTDREDRRMVAYHEAGHAAMTIIAWNGERIPDYASIIPNNSGGTYFEGVVYDDVGAHKSKGTITFEEMRRMVRKLLAGRAGEQVIGGPAKISNGASSDLRHATAITTEAFSELGFSPDMEKRPGANLAVTLATQISGHNQEGHDLVVTAHDLLNQRLRIADMARDFLETEYNECVRLLEANRALLDAIATRLLRTNVLGRDELRRILKAHPLVA